MVYFVASTLALALVSDCAWALPSNPGPVQPQPQSTKCDAGIATLRSSAGPTATSFIIQAWPKSGSAKFTVRVDKWDETLSLSVGDTLMSNGKAELPSETPVEISVRRVSGAGSIALEIVLFGDNKCRLRFPTPSAGGI